MEQGTHHSEETKARIRAHMIGRKRPQHVKDKISESNRKNHPFKGKHLSEAHRTRISESLQEFHKKRSENKSKRL